MPTTPTARCTAVRWCVLPLGHDLGDQRLRDASGALLRDHTAGTTDLTDVNGGTFVVELTQCELVGGDEPHTEPAQIHMDAHPLTSRETRTTALALLVAADQLDGVNEDAETGWLRGEHVVEPVTSSQARGDDLCSCGKPAAHVDADEDSAEWACRVPAPRGLFPLPIGPVPADDEQLNERTGAPDPNDRTDLASWSGHCHDFCSSDERNQTVYDHGGPYCYSPPIGLGELAPLDLAGDTAEFYVNLAGSYTHGTYYRWDVWGRRNFRRYVRVAVIANGVEPDADDAESRAFHFTGAQARSFAAYLLRAADVLEGLTRPIGSGD